MQVACDESELQKNLDDWVPHELNDVKKPASIILLYKPEPHWNAFEARAAGMDPVRQRTCKFLRLVGRALQPFGSRLFQGTTCASVLSGTCCHFCTGEIVRASNSHAALRTQGKPRRFFTGSMNHFCFTVQKHRRSGAHSSFQLPRPLMLMTYLKEILTSHD